MSWQPHSFGYTVLCLCADSLICCIKCTVCWCADSFGYIYLHTHTHTIQNALCLLICRVPMSRRGHRPCTSTRWRGERSDVQLERSQKPLKTSPSSGWARGSIQNREVVEVCECRCECRYACVLVGVCMSASVYLHVLQIVWLYAHPKLDLPVSVMGKRPGNHVTDI